jgi:hypothetical protein
VRNSTTISVLQAVCGDKVVILLLSLRSSATCRLSKAYLCETSSSGTLLVHQYTPRLGAFEVPMYLIV